jgi:hypothetical protein
VLIALYVRVWTPPTRIYYHLTPIKGGYEVTVDRSATE